jgi:hypothetical protein
LRFESKDSVRSIFLNMSIYPTQAMMRFKLSIQRDLQYGIAIAVGI